MSLSFEEKLKRQFCYVHNPGALPGEEERTTRYYTINTNKDENPLISIRWSDTWDNDGIFQDVKKDDGTVLNFEFKGSIAHYDAHGINPIQNKKSFKPYQYEYRQDFLSEIRDHIFIHMEQISDASKFEIEKESTFDFTLLTDINEDFTHYPWKMGRGCEDAGHNLASSRSPFEFGYKIDHCAFIENKNMDQEKLLKLTNYQLIDDNIVKLSNYDNLKGLHPSDHSAISFDIESSNGDLSGSKLYSWNAEGFCNIIPSSLGSLNKKLEEIEKQKINEFEANRQDILISDAIQSRRASTMPATLTSYAPYSLTSYFAGEPEPESEDRLIHSSSISKISIPEIPLPDITPLANFQFKTLSNGYADGIWSIEDWNKYIKRFVNCDILLIQEVLLKDYITNIKNNFGGTDILRDKVDRIAQHLIKLLKDPNDEWKWLWDNFTGLVLWNSSKYELSFNKKLERELEKIIDLDEDDFLSGIEEEDEKETKGSSFFIFKNKETEESLNVTNVHLKSQTGKDSDEGSYRLTRFFNEIGFTDANYLYTNHVVEMKNIINRINNIKVPSYYLIGDYNTYYADQILRNIYMMDVDERRKVESPETIRYVSNLPEQETDEVVDSLVSSLMNDLVDELIEERSDAPKGGRKSCRRTKRRGGGKSRRKRRKSTRKLII